MRWSFKFSLEIIPFLVLGIMLAFVVQTHQPYPYAIMVDEGETRFDYYCGADKIPSNKQPEACNHITPPPSKTAFPLHAVGNVDADIDCDVWTIDEAGVIENTVHDLEFY